MSRLAVAPRADAAIRSSTVDAVVLVARAANDNDSFGNLAQLAYDGFDRLKAWTFPSKTSQIVGEARTNDAFVFTGGVAVVRPYEVNGLNQYTSAGSASLTGACPKAGRRPDPGDADGNLVSDGASTWGVACPRAGQRPDPGDAENRLISSAGPASASLVYDPLGRLWQTSGGSAGVTDFLHDGDEIAGEYAASGAILRRYMWGPGVDEPIVWDEGGQLSCGTPAAPTTFVLHADHQGSVIARADCWGNQEGIDTYDEYGVPGAANAGRFQYTGQAWIPELGMYYYKARFYAPSLGRFMQTDPVGYKDQINLYEYAGDDPVDKTDPSGLETDTLENKPLTGSRLPGPNGNPVSVSLGAAFGAGVHQTASNSAGPQQIAEFPVKSDVPAPTGRIAPVLQCMAKKCGDERVTITSTHEPLPNGKHGATTPHGRGEAADLRVERGHERNILQCAAECGASFGLNERLHPSARGVLPHVHIQTGRGTRGGRGDLPQSDDGQP